VIRDPFLDSQGVSKQLQIERRYSLLIVNNSEQVHKQAAPLILSKMISTGRREAYGRPARWMSPLGYTSNFRTDHAVIVRLTSIWHRQTLQP
jgi:hypothetical protein